MCPETYGPAQYTVLQAVRSRRIKSAHRKALQEQNWNSGCFYKYLLPHSALANKALRALVTLTLS